jgi:antitoxin component YwqK of YwqJK toxin-antitoxin module
MKIRKFASFILLVSIPSVWSAQGNLDSLDFEKSEVLITIYSDSTKVESVYLCGTKVLLKKWNSDNELEFEIHYHNDFKYLVIYWFESGGPQAIQRFDPEGRNDGIQMEYFENGFPKWKRHYTNGKESGIWREWYSNGLLKQEIEFDYSVEDSTFCSNVDIILETKEDPETGELIQVLQRFCRPYNGKYIAYGNDGMLEVEGEYLFGKKHNVWRTISRECGLIKEEYFVNGLLMKLNEIPIEIND